MKLLGIDYGERKIGLALAVSKIAEPYSVAHFQNFGQVIAVIAEIVEKEGIDEIVIGISEGKTAEETKEFAKRLADVVAKKITFHDETLTSKEAQRLSIEAGTKRKKRKSLEDAFAATLMLQDYMDNCSIAN
jgi:putative Holliday junction resolvase